MKYNYNFKGSNLCLVVFLVIVYLFNCIVWLLFRKYVMFLILVLLALFVMYLYFYTYYTLEKDYFVIHLGFIKIKTKYKDILDVKKENNKVTFKTINFDFSIYPVPEDKFIKEINSKLNKEEKEKKPRKKKEVKKTTKKTTKVTK